MVQGKPLKADAASLTGRQKQKGKAITQRKAAPNIRRHHNSVTAAINRRNEQLMAARLAHEGGTLVIIPKPERVDRYEKGGARTGERQSRQLFQSSMARHARLRREGQTVGDVGAKAGGGGDAKRGSLPVKRKRGLKDGVRQVGDDWFDDADAELEKLRYDSGDDNEDEKRSDDDGQQLQGDERKQDEGPEEEKSGKEQGEGGKDVARHSADANSAAAAPSGHASSAAASAASKLSATPSPSSASAGEQEQEERPAKQRRMEPLRGRDSAARGLLAATTLTDTSLSNTPTS